MFDVVCFGQQNWDFCWTGKQQLLSRLARFGGRILYVDPDPVAASAAAAPGGPAARGLRKTPYGDLWIFTPATSSRLGWRLSRRLDRPRLKAAFRWLGIHAPVAMVMHPRAAPLVDLVKPMGILYYAVDEHTGFGGMSEADRRTARAEEEAMLARADVCLGVSPRLVERFRQSNPHAYLLENGADSEHYHPARLARCTPPAALADLEGPVLGFIGQVDERVDQALLLAIAEARPDWTVALAGRVKKGVDVGRLEQAPNVRLLGYQPYEALPQVAAAVDVWLVPYEKTPLTESCNPLKVYEYLATGRPVVSTPLEGLVICRDQVSLALGADAFIQAIEAALRDPAAGEAERLRHAAEHDWTSRVQALAGYLREAAERGAARRGAPAAALRLMPARRARRRLATSPALNEYGQPIERPGIGGARGLLRRATRAVGLARGLRRGPPRRILVLRQSRLGDMVTILPALAALRQAYPQAHIALAVRPGYGVEPLAAASPDVDEVLSLDFAWSDRPADLARGVAGLVGSGYDLVITGGRWFFMAEGLFAGAPAHVGVYDGERLQTLDGRFLPRDWRRHEADVNLDLVEALTGRSFPALRRLQRPGRETTEADRSGVEAALRVPEGQPILLVHPGANRASRRWPTDRLAETLRRLLERRPELHVVFTGVASEQPLVAAVVERLPAEAHPRLRDLAGKTDLDGLSALVDRASVVLCNDTGVMHLARARGAPLVATLGPENDAIWGPYPAGAAPAVSLRAEVPCAPCARLSCDALYCLRSVAPEAVADEIEQLLDRPRAASGAEAAVVRRRRSLSWSALAQAGHALPLVTVVAAVGDAAEADAVVGQVERQTYPAIEIVLLAPEGLDWRDRRSGRAREALPVRLLPASSGDEATLARTAARGDLVLRWRPGLEWQPGRIGDEVATAMRAPEAAALRDGAPVAAKAAADGPAILERAPQGG